MKFSALLVDGALELADERRLAVEIKSRMSWSEACVAEHEFRNFLKRTERRPFPVDGGIVFFGECSGHWSERPASQLIENGWNNWYRSHREVEGFRFDLLRLCSGKLEGFPLVDALLAEAQNPAGTGSQ